MNNLFKTIDLFSLSLFFFFFLYLETMNENGGSNTKELKRENIFKERHHLESIDNKY